ncbi:MAG: SpoIIE family protein phosphatase [bacterium]
MKENKINREFKFKNIATLSLLAFLFMVRVIGEYFFFYSDISRLGVFKVYNIGTSLLLLLACGYYVYLRREQIFEKISIRQDLRRQLYIVFLSLISFVILYKFYFNFTNDSKLSAGLNIFVYSFFALILLTITSNILIFLAKRLFILRQRNKRNLSYAILIVIIASFVFATLNYSLNVNYLIVDSNATSIISAVFFVLLFILGWLVSGKNNDLLELSAKLKFQLLVLYLASGITAFYICGLSLAAPDKLSKILTGFLVGSNILIGGVAMVFATHCFRLALSLIITFPLGSALRQKSTEINSLIYLNKVVAESIDKEPNYIFEVTSKLALVSTRATACWVEIYGDEQEYKIAAVQNITPQMISKLHLNGKLKEESLKLENSVHYGDIHKDKQLAKVFAGSQFKDLIIVPIFSRNQRIGTLYTLQVNDYGFESSDLNLLKAFSDSLKLALENQNLLKESMEKERLKEELALAQRMQINILPQKMPFIHGYDIAAFSNPAVEVGGDYYDVVRLAGGNFCVLSADVSGKGLSAAFYVAQLKGIIVSLAPLCSSPAELLKKINASIYHHIDKKSFITMSAIEIDTDKHEILMARAGHTPIYVCNNGKTKPYTPKGFGLGLTHSSIFDPILEQKTLTFEPGSVCLMVSDGILEQRNAKLEELGSQAIINMLDCRKYNEAQHILDDLTILSDKFAAGSEPHDDRTVIAITRKKDNL